MYSIVTALTSIVRHENGQWGLREPAGRKSGKTLLGLRQRPQGSDWRLRASLVPPGGRESPTGEAAGRF